MPSSSLADSIDRLRLAAPPRPGALALVLATVPAICVLADFWLGTVAFRTVALLLSALGLLAWGASVDRRPDTADGVTDRDGLIRCLDRIHARSHGASGAQPPVCIALQIAPADPTAGDADRRDARNLSALRQALRAQDRIARLGDGRYAVALDPPPCGDLETLMQLAARLQDRVAPPCDDGPRGGFAQVTVGIAADRLLAEAGVGQTGRTTRGAALLAAATGALDEARRAAEGAVRVYTVDLHRARTRRLALAADLEGALASGQIRPWFQPQLSTDTGQVSGFEALARWVHPDHGIVPPADFLPAVAEAGLTAQLTDVILQQSLLALRGWERAGYSVPAVAVNLSQSDLDDPQLADRILWQADRYEVPAHRLTLEILESVVAGDPGDTPSRNIAALASAGCGIDLDDFGTGHASITSLRRFSVSRLKIDRSFVRHVDSDPVQQQMVAAILSMAERLRLDTVAEGVETAAEHARLCELGCDHVQGYALGRPMPVEDTFPWLARHLAQLPQLPEMGRRSG